MTPKERAELLLDKIPEVAIHMCENNIKYFQEDVINNKHGFEYWTEVKEEIELAIKRKEEVSELNGIHADHIVIDDLKKKKHE